MSDNLTSLDCLFRPHRIAVVGAGSKASNLGHVVVRNLLEGNFPGVVYPINSHHESIGGVAAYPSVLETPEIADLAVICVPADSVAEVVRQCAERGTKGLVILSAGFRETGPEGAQLESEVLAIVRDHGMRLVGPNCLGFEVPALDLNASFATHMPQPGGIALISQSGALTSAVIEWAIGENIGFSTLISLGNAPDVGVGSMLDYLADDPDTDSAVVYVESVSDAQTFTEAAAKFAAKKPLVVYKAGRFAASAQATVSHTGAMAGADSVYSAAFDRVGAARVLDIAKMYHVITLLDTGRPVAGPELAVVTNAGGPGVMAVDALAARGGELATLSDSTIRRLDASLPAAWSRSNPVDVLGDAPAQRYADAVEIVAQDPGVDAVIVLLTPQAVTDVVASADALIEAYGKTDKPVYAVWMGGGPVNEEAIARLRTARIPFFKYPENAVNAFMTAVEAHAPQVRGRDYELVPSGTDEFEPDRRLAEEIIAQVPDNGLLPEYAAEQLFEAYGITVARARLATSADAAADLAEETGYPVVMKISSKDITHKSDVGGVMLDLEDAAAVRSAYEQITESARRARPDARIDGAVVQRQLPQGVRELIMGSHVDASFGAVIMIADGGTTAELMNDSSLQLAPVDASLARSMLEDLRIWPLLEGYRGAEGVDLDALCVTIQRFSRLVEEHPEITEIEVNPLLAIPGESIAVDARAVVDLNALHNPPEPYSHLGIRTQGRG